jgi:RimJ/RimL family protein N-acetyltransferase
MKGPRGALWFRPLARSDLSMLHEWLCRPHVSEWWGPPASYTQVEAEYAPYTAPASTIRGYITFLGKEPIGFIQSYVVMGSGDGWWPDETDPGTRGIDHFLANEYQLGRGLGSTVVSAFVAGLLLDPLVTKVQTDPSPENQRAIRSYLRAGFFVVEEVMTPDGRALLMVRRRYSGPTSG